MVGEPLSELLAKVVPLALGAAISPMVLLLEVGTLSLGRRRLLRGWLVLAGAATALLAWGIVGWTIMTRLPTPSSGTDVRAGVLDVAAALLLAVLGVRSLRIPPAPARTPDPDAPAHLLVAYGLGLAVMGTNLTSLVLFLPAVHDLAHSDASSSDVAVAATVLLLITLIPALVPVLAVTVGGAWARTRLDRLGQLVQRHRAGIGATVCFGFAIYLAVRGIPQITAA